MPAAMLLVVDWAPDSRQVSSSVITVWPFIHAHTVCVAALLLCATIEEEKIRFINGERKRTKLYLALITVLHSGGK
jgi:hypothetical protein